MDLKVNGKTVICFDLDDTIYNELDYLKSAYMEIALHIAKDNGLLLFAQMFSIYRKGGDVFGYLTENHACDKSELLLRYRNHVPKIKAFNGVHDLLSKIKDKKGKLGLITDGRSNTQRNKLRALKLMDLFDKIVISEEIGTQKPHEANYIEIEKHFPECRYTYIADNFKKDFIVPNKRNWNSIGLLDNGKNIHYNASDFSKEEFRPKQLITTIDHINIL